MITAITDWLDKTTGYCFSGKAAAKTDDIFRLIVTDKLGNNCIQLSTLLGAEVYRVAFHGFSLDIYSKLGRCIRVSNP